MKIHDKPTRNFKFLMVSQQGLVYPSWIALGKRTIQDHQATWARKITGEKKEPVKGSFGKHVFTF